jgi:hypothetical protein
MYPISSLVAYENFKDETQRPNTGVLLPATRSQTEPQTISPQSAPFLHTKKTTDQHFLNFPKPGSMEFSDTQKAHWEKHTSPTVSRKIQKLKALRNIARDQEKAGLQFEGRRSWAEAEADLAKEQFIQTSQAGRTQNPLSFLENSIKSLADGLNYYFQSGSSIPQLTAELSKPIEGRQYTVRKSEALSKREAAGEDILSFGIGIADSDHGSIEIQKGINAFLANHFKPERGDIFLTEAYLVFEQENGKEKVVMPSLERHHNLWCRGIPIEFCRFLREPEKETGHLNAVTAERRDMVNKFFEFLMNAIPPGKALEARQKLSKRNSEVNSADTEFKVELIIDYQHYCDPAKKTRLERRIDPLADALKKQNAAAAAAAISRDTAYFNQITEALAQLKPGARLYYLSGGAHFRRLHTQLNKIDSFFVDIVTPSPKDEF